MTFVAHVVRVLIASPSDTARARDVIEDACHGGSSNLRGQGGGARRAA